MHEFKIGAEIKKFHCSVDVTPSNHANTFDDENCRLSTCRRSQNTYNI